MENHPIPQDVTGFKFRLIGSVTIKQFLYILGAGAFCGIIFILPISFLIKLPLITFIAGIGAGLAFLPIEGRPMDVMLMNFLKALPAENRYIFRKQGTQTLLHKYFTLQEPKTVVKKEGPTQKDNRRELLINRLVRKSAPYRADDSERKQITNIQGIFDNADTPVTGLPGVNTSPLAQRAYSTVVKPPSSPAQKDATKPIATIQPAQKTPPHPIVQPEPPHAPIDTLPKPNHVQSPQKIHTPISSTSAKTVAPENQIASGFPHIPDTPNVVLGIVKDPRGKVLPNIIVEVVDENKNPVRAFKTNALGQFASATPLSAGKYFMMLEDTRHIHEFSPIEIQMKNEIFQPLEIISTDQREKLRQELFGSAHPATQQ